MEYKDFFRDIAGNTPYHYQERLENKPWSDLPDIPTGLGKTAGMAKSWKGGR